MSSHKTPTPEVTTTAPLKDDFSVEEVARHRWTVHPLTVRRLINSGALKAYRVGRLMRLKRTELERYEATN